MYANIIVDITHEKLDRTFQYSIPSELEGMLKIGEQVYVPFGNGNKETKGYVIGLTEQCDWDADKIKSITRVADEGMKIEGRLLALADWIKNQYGGTLIQALKVVLPIKQKEKEKVQKKIALLLNKEEAQSKLEEYRCKNRTARARLLDALIQNPELDYQVATKELKVSSSAIQALALQGVLDVKEEAIYRDPILYRQSEKAITTFTEEQREAIKRFCEDYGNGIRKTYLIHGVTGSGKTEIYMEAIAEVVSKGKQAIVLIPEIALTYQTVMRFQRRFGERISMMNSRMSTGERYDQTLRVQRGEIDVMIGPRSALFTPFENLGLIVIDEEHEASYKSENTPRYHARETAIARAQMEGASVILGSATPSVDAYYKVQRGEYELIELRKRVMEQELAVIETVDMREELRQGNKSMFSDSLREKLNECLRDGQQAMLFLNRRGYAGFISCRSCGYVVKCPHCDISLTDHNNGKLICHYCGHQEPVKKDCPSCGSPYIGGYKAGTQQVEEQVKKEFPEARVLRMDKDTTSKKNSYEKILSTFANGEADILIGTQMIVKGHDFANVTLVGVLAADLSLYANDYRSGERTFQLLTQAAGRAGRGKLAGQVVIQTYNPEHYSIQRAAKQDYKGFYMEEMNYRSLAGYPPAEQIMAILLTSKDEELLTQGAAYLAKYAHLRGDSQKEHVEIIGPTVPYVSKKNDIYRQVIYIKCESDSAIIELKNNLEEYIDINQGFSKMNIQFDFNPMSIF
ncbi:primosomal protein N' [Lachnospiraceae bacterium OttesenSCG-928-E19]|nr:primosomal protein N' [Lachnospiraceae bacterium OttesenSCG-928-E19]